MAADVSAGTGQDETGAAAATSAPTSADAVISWSTGSGSSAGRTFAAIAAFQPFPPAAQRRAGIRGSSTLHTRVASIPGGSLLLQLNSDAAHRMLVPFHGDRELVIENAYSPCWHRDCGLVVQRLAGLGDLAVLFSKTLDLRLGKEGSKWKRESVPTDLDLFSASFNDDTWTVGAMGTLLNYHLTP